MRFHVAEAGPDGAPPVFLTHGWPQHWWLWRHVIPQLATAIAGLRVGPARARLERRSARRRLHEDRDGRRPARRHGRAGGRPAGLVGHDWGAFSGMIACVKAPERFTGFVSCSVPHLWPRDRFNPRRLVPARLSGADQHTVSRRAADAQGLRDAPAEGRPRERALERRGAARVRRRDAQAEGREGDGRHLPAVPARRSCRGSSAARMRISGSRSPRACSPAPRTSRSRVDSLEGANADDLVVQWVGGAGHFLPDEAPEVVVQARARAPVTAFTTRLLARVRRHGLRRLGAPAGARGPCRRSSSAAIATILRGPTSPLTVAGRTDARRARLGPGRSATTPRRSTRCGSTRCCRPTSRCSNATPMRADGFDARHDAASRTYCYRVLAPPRARRVCAARAWWVGATLDREALDACAARARRDARLHGVHADARPSTCASSATSVGAQWREPRRTARVLDQADTFMRHMNRVLVGTMLEVAHGAAHARGLRRAARRAARARRPGRRRRRTAWRSARVAYACDRC